MLDGDSWILYFEPFISASRRATQPCRNVIHFVKISFEFSPDTFQNTRGLQYSEEVARSLGRFGRTSRKVLCGNVIESSDRYHCPLFYLVLDPLNRLTSIENGALSQGCFIRNHVRHFACTFSFHLTSTHRYGRNSESGDELRVADSDSSEHSKS